MTPELILAAISGLGSLINEGVTLYKESKAGRLNDDELTAQWKQAVQANIDSDAILEAAVAAYNARHPGKAS